MSTRELQLVSLDCCRACRLNPTLHVRIDRNTPRILWAPRAGTLVTDGSQAVGVSAGRVPPVCAMGLLWTLPTELLFRSAAKELWQYLKVLVLRNETSEVDWLGSVNRGGVWPPRLQRLVLDARWLEQPIQRMVWPVDLLELEFGEWFNEPIVGVAWPDSVQRISFGEHFDRPIAQVLWPRSLQHLSFLGYFNQPLHSVSWPPLLRNLCFGDMFRQPITNPPPSLKQLRLGACSYPTLFTNGQWPVFLEEIWFGGGSISLAGVAWPRSLRKLSLMGNFNQPIVGNDLPTSLEEVRFGDWFNQPIDAVEWPLSIRSISFGERFNQPITDVQWPASLRA